jgi:hypothetical protein
MSREGIELDAGHVGPSQTFYEVTCPHRHRTLKVGDCVRMAENVDFSNVLIRTDFTLHSLMDEFHQYVHLRALPKERQ